MAKIRARPMDLYILRHAIAGERNASTPGGDSQRPLTVEGADKMLRIARGMKASGLSFDLILSSPSLRAKQTAEIVVNVFGHAKSLKFSSALAADGNPQELVSELRRDHRKRKSVLLVGHEPYLSRLISLLISGSTSLPITLKKGGLCKLSIDALRYGRCASLEYLLTPRQLRLLK
jgi:phosphohistidine phosphatase